MFDFRPTNEQIGSLGESKVYANPYPSQGSNAPVFGVFAVLGVVGGLAGMTLFPRHRTLGFTVGMAVGLVTPIAAIFLSAQPLGTPIAR